MDECYIKVLKRQLQHSNFDDKAALLFCTVTQRKGTFYTALSGTYHIIRESIYFALGLMQIDSEKNAGTVERILNAVCDLQDQDPQSPTFGVWPLYMEETLKQQPRPDWNWSDFCGRGLLQFVIGYKKFFSEKTMEKIKQAVYCAAVRIMRRNVSPAYTNISCMGTYTVLAAGEYLEDSELLAYAKERFRKLYTFNMFHQCVSEYNSSTYTVESLTDLSLMAKDVHDAKIQKMAEELLDMQWNYTLEHFCPDNGQWTGPQSRCYDTLQGNSLLSFLQVGAGNRVKLIEPENMMLQPIWLQAGLHIPERLIGMLTAKESHFFRRHPVLLNEPEIYASQFRDKEQSMGSFNFSDFWTQRRPLIAYFGSCEKPAYFRLRCIHDDFDFASGVFACSQYRNIALCGMSLCNDHGDRHFTLDPIENQKILVSRLAFRFEFGGCGLDTMEFRKTEYGYQIITGDTVFVVWIGNNGFCGKPLCVLQGETEDTRYLDLILYDGPSKDLSVASGIEAYASMVVGMFRVGDPAIQKLQEFIRKEKNRLWIDDGYLQQGIVYAEKIADYNTQVLRMKEFRKCNIIPARHVWRVTAKTDTSEE